MKTNHHYLGNYPNARHSGYSENIQGVTHDENNWYFTQSSNLWKFPVSHDLNQRVTKADPAKGILKSGIPVALKNKGYNHFGDFDYFNGYLFIPLTGPNLVAWILIFRALDLKYLGGFQLWIRDNINPAIPQIQAPWCAINPKTGLLYTSYGEISSVKPILVYKFDHDALKTYGVINVPDLNSRYNLLRNSPLVLKAMQGGTFNQDGSILYLINGYFENCDEQKCGINVFDTLHGKLIEQSMNGRGNFNYEFHQFPEYQEAEGITFWDLDSGIAPGIRGQVHALMLENDWSSDDDLYFKHYKLTVN